MDFSFRLRDPIDLLRILYCSLFNTQALPSTNQKEEHLTFVIQALVVSAASQTILGVLCFWAKVEFQWSAMIHGWLMGLLIGFIMSILTLPFSAPSEKQSEAVNIGIRFGLPASLLLGATFGLIEDKVIACLVSGAILSSAVHPRFSGLANAFFSAMTVTVFGVLGAGIELINSYFGFVIGVVITGSAIASGLALATAVSVIIDKINRIKSVLIDCYGGFVMLLGLCAFFFYLIQQSSLLNANLTPIPSVLISTFVIALCYSRLPLWPFEAVFGELWWRTQERYNPAKLSAAIRTAYFDYHMLVPLPGEVSALLRVSRTNHHQAVRDAVDLACLSDHLPVAISVLRTFAIDDPLGVRAQIRAIANKRDQTLLLRYVMHRLPQAPSSVCQTQQQIEEISDSLKDTLGLNIGKSDEELTHRPILRSRLYNVASTELISEPARKDLVEAQLQKLFNAFDSFKAIRGKKMRHVALLGAIYEILAKALRCQTIAEIGGFSAPVLPEELPHLFPSSLRDALRDVNQLAKTVNGYSETTSPVTQRDALLQSNEQLESLASQVRRNLESLGFFGPVLVYLIINWRQLLASAGGELAREEQIRPVSNPYVYGNPVRGSLFVGREDVIRHLQAEWGHHGQCSSVIIYGHRRMGKSSILQNLGVGDRFGKRTVIVDFNMQRVGHVHSTGELLLNLALKIYDVCGSRKIRGLEEPRESDFLKPSPYLAFDRFLFQLNQHREGHRFIITVDEFEVIERQIKEGRLDQHLIEHWRGTFTTYHWLIMAFAGLHTLEEMRRDFWHPLFASVHAIEVGFLSREAATQLITKPSHDFAIDYSPQAVKKIIESTGGQPYLTQLICHTLVIRFNKQVFEEGVKRERCFQLSDVEAVLESHEFKRECTAYFNGVWEQAEENHDEVIILKALSRANSSVFEIATKTTLRINRIQDSVEILRRRKVISLRNGKYTYNVPLMREWVERKKYHSNGR